MAWLQPKQHFPTCHFTPPYWLQVAELFLVKSAALRIEVFVHRGFLKNMLQAVKALPREAFHMFPVKGSPANGGSVGQRFWLTKETDHTVA